MRINIVAKSNFVMTAKREILMITAVRPYTVQSRQQQQNNFGSKIPDKFLQACRKGSAEFMNRIRDGFPHDYTIAENQAAIREIIEDPKTKMTPTLQILGKCYGVLKN